MVSGLQKVRAIASLAFQETLRRKVLYVALGLVIFLVAAASSTLAVMQMALRAGEQEAVRQLGGRLVLTVALIWSFAGVCLAFSLGAIGMSTEVAARTIVNVLSRPVERAVYLAGRWLGILVFLWLFQLAGIAIALLTAWGFDVEFAPVLWLGFVGMLVQAAFFSGVSLAFSVVMPAVPAAACAVLLSMLPQIAGSWALSSWKIVRAAAIAVYYAAPASMPSNLISDSFDKQLLRPDYSIYVQVLGENVLYTLAVFAAASIIFTRRELRLR